AAACLADPAGGCCLAVVGSVPQEQVHALLVIGRRMLLVGREEGAHTARDRVLGIDHLDAEPLQRTMADVAASYQLPVGTVWWIPPHRVAQVQAAAPAFEKFGHRALLLGCHPDEMRASVLLRALKAVTQDHQELD